MSLPIPLPLQIEVLIDTQVRSPADRDDVCRAVAAAASFAGFSRGHVGVRITDDAVIRQVNRRHLEHDYATDVISFSYLADPPSLSGELIVSAETAVAQAADLGWPPAHELLLYVVHGVLHLTGLDDQQADQRSRMRQAEETVMLRLGIDEILRYGADGERVVTAEEG